MILRGLLLAAAGTLVACSSPTISLAPESELSSDWAKFEKIALRYGSIVSLPPFERSPQASLDAVDAAIAAANTKLDTIGKLKPSAVTFENTIGALDDMSFEVSLVANRTYMIKETSENAEHRAKATEAIKKVDEWAVGLDYREDVYRAVKTYADTKPELEGETKRMLEQTLRDYRRAGLHLAKAERSEVEALRKELAAATTEFRTNITNAKKSLKFTKAELDGLPESFLEQVKTGNDEYTLQANVTFHYLNILRSAKVEQTRIRFSAERLVLASDKNVPLLKKVMQLRAVIANKLGYKTWADYRCEVKMAGDGKTASDFLMNLKRGLEPKWKAEMAEFTKIKRAETGDPNAVVHMWDIFYYENLYKKEKFSVDAEQLRVFFPYEQTLQGMFRVYEEIFRLKIVEAKPDYKWNDQVTLHYVYDSFSGEPLGALYLDMFPREGKFNHFAMFPLISGKRLSSGHYQRPTVALICNFPPPGKDKPSLLSHDNVETLFHEFGHALHGILTRTKFSRFAGTSVPRDFVEAPSQMLENWIWDKSVLDSFAADYRDPSKKIPQSILDKLQEAKKATIARHYRRQLSYGLVDLGLHTLSVDEANAVDPVELSHQITEDVYMKPQDNTSFVGYFGHLMGYDAGYYGYAWADAISADMATVFETAPNRYYDKKAGMRLRREIYEVGDSRDVNESIEKFLGRPRSLKPFLNDLGIAE